VKSGAREDFAATLARALAGAVERTMDRLFGPVQTSAPLARPRRAKRGTAARAAGASRPVEAGTPSKISSATPPVAILASGAKPAPVKVAAVAKPSPAPRHRKAKPSSAAKARRDLIAQMARARGGGLL